MRVVSCHLQNFGSYKELDFDFQNQGLTLIQGSTGSGKSTLCDAIPWILFGVTAKGGKVDEIRSWNSEDSTSGFVRLDSGITITRHRCPNDLFWSDSHGAQNRGRDLGDTQRRINELLGIDADLYLSGAYFHEFSQTSQFFTTTAKVRRETLEQIVDLSLAKKLQVKTSEAKKDLAKQQAEQAAKASTLKSNIELLNRLQKTEHTKAEDWQRSQDKAIEYIKKTYERFEASRDHVVSGTCPECGTKLKDDVHTRKNGPNPCAAQLEAKLLEKNPHAGSVKDFSDEISAKEREFDKAEHFVKDMSEMISDYDTLLHVVDIFRSELIKNTVSYIEHNTNELLTKYFDAEICIQLDTAEKDKLDVTIQKDGNVATYTQLSKGQRQLLKLCFGVSVMQSVQNHNGVTFSQLFFDEALDGLDDELKIKAYKLLDNLALSHESVFVVEHNSALKSMFPNSYNVTLVNGSSCVERA